MNCTLETLDMAAAQMVACSLYRVLIDEPNTIALTVNTDRQVVHFTLYSLLLKTELLFSMQIFT